MAPDLPEGALAQLRAHFREEDRQLARLFEIALLQRSGLDVAAFEAATRLGEEWPKRVVFGLAWRSLEKLGLERSSMADQTYERYVDAE